MASVRKASGALPTRRASTLSVSRRRWILASALASFSSVRRQSESSAGPREKKAS